MFLGMFKFKTWLESNAGFALEEAPHQPILNFEKAGVEGERRRSRRYDGRWMEGE
jgi:hypothetical protein